MRQISAPHLDMGLSARLDGELRALLNRAVKANPHYGNIAPECNFELARNPPRFARVGRVEEHQNVSTREIGLDLLLRLLGNLNIDQITKHVLVANLQGRVEFRSHNLPVAPAMAQEDPQPGLYECRHRHPERFSRECGSDDG